MVGTLEKEIHSVRLGAGKNVHEKQLAELFQHKAESYCQDIPGVQTFGLLAFYGKGEAEARHPFLINSEPDYGGLSTEGPTNQGQIQQMMRHNETAMQIAFRQSNAAFEQLNLNMRIMSEIASKALTENRDYLEVVTKLVLERSTNDHDNRMKQLEFERASEERKNLMRSAPALLNTIFGREVFPQATEDTALIETIADKLSPEDIEKLAGIVPVELLGPLMNRFQKAFEAKQLKRSQEQRLLAKVNPEDDAAGD
jgi:hypothetical protein